MADIRPPMDDMPTDPTVASASQHISNPHESTPSDGQAYENLLAALRKDLQLDPTVDLTPPAVINAEGSPLAIDSGTAALVFSASSSSATITVKHRVGRMPVVVTGCENGSIWIDIASRTATSFTLQGFYTSAISGTVTADWVAVG